MLRYGGALVIVLYCAPHVLHMDKMPLLEAAKEGEKVLRIYPCGVVRRVSVHE